ncbi:hypothetical protein DSC91_006104 [Paraburkholderia caffeinilytica]|uniref:DUF2844 domain-containing protein n=1 Tax=Paraburkholderia caffeinilytica TaxID=1761016 RepID=A0ABQ1MYU9_9BURK|nr:DUF2844 domain-containing protein [Paraburkholderia caffeinilytica]AXL52905.1 hypothetical protein DSC91_006104 [Paraburkholderia caffeinilytica]GGC49515.1 hypothetical protein GCM10011400_41180 [Paraburkholderia caffeinilytica]CAB3788091.1 hypothetical protein LMG28690_02571 [Paraburkholderia caffeinilytica]
MKLLRIAILAATLLPLVSRATLGGAPGAGTSSSPTTLRAAPQSSPAPGAAKTTTAAPYTLRESRDANGVTIREYVLPSNVVFAVTWAGPIRPDMIALLGSYFPTYVSAAESRARGTGPLVEGSDDFRIESAGRLGRFTGAAYLPRLMPANLRAGDLQ